VNIWPIFSAPASSRSTHLGTKPESMIRHYTLAADCAFGSNPPYELENEFVEGASQRAKKTCRKSSQTAVRRYTGQPDDRTGNVLFRVGMTNNGEPNSG
jgi:hypothetical protein